MECFFVFMEMDFVPIDYQMFDYDGRNHVKIFGRNKEGERVCLIDSCPCYMWVILNKGASNDEIEELKSKYYNVVVQTKDRTTRVENIEIVDKNFLGKSVKALKVFATNYKDLHSIAGEVDSDIIYKRRGYDLGFITHYIIEKKMNPLGKYKINCDFVGEEDYDFILETLEVEKVVSLNSFEKSDVDFDYEFRSLAYDIETDALKPETDGIVMVSLYGKDFRKVISCKGGSSDHDFVEFVDSEKELIKAFVKEVKKYSPDFLIGYNSDNFDLPFIKKRAQIVGANFSLGLDKSVPKIKGGMNLVAKISGITHIDLLRFIRTAYSQYMQSETLSLNDVANEFLGEAKLGFDFKHSDNIKESEWDKYFEYNLHDSRLTIRLFEKFLPDMLEFSKIVCEPVYNICRNGLSRQIEGYVLHNLDRFNEIPEKKPTRNALNGRFDESSEGAFVFEPKAGLYENLAMFDFTSMHTSIIITHNLSKGTLIKESEDAISSPEIDLDGKKKKYYFSKEKGFFPILLEEIFDKRKEYKRAYRENPNPITKARSNAFKVLSASAHGYVAFAGARYHSKEASMSILAFVRKYNKDIIKKILNSSLTVIYGDTDSVAFTMEDKSKDDIVNLLEELNLELPGVMRLELEGFFKRGLWVNVRGGDIGAKKKYAMIDEDGNVKIRGFETVRRDWCRLARETQENVLKMILNDGNERRAVDYVKEVIKKIKGRGVLKDEVLIKTQLKKPISDYKSISPHVTAAMKMKNKGMNVDVGSLIEYYIGETGGSSKLIRDKALLKEEEGDYDIKYYLEKQLLPSIEQIFNVFNINSQELIDGQKQENLNKWF